LVIFGTVVTQKVSNHKW